jgi:hypothetical protein
VDTQFGITQGISRRRLVKGAAWSVPVVAVASVAPAYAASPGTCPTVTGVVTNPSPRSSATVALTLSPYAGGSYSVAITSVSGGSFVLTGALPNPVVFTSSSASVVLQRSTNGNVNSPGTTVTVGYQVTRGATVCTADTFTFTYFN